MAETKENVNILKEEEKKELEDVKKMIEKKTDKKEITNVDDIKDVVANLTPEEVENVQKMFKDIWNFENLSEKIIQPFDGAIEEAGAIINNDPIMNASSTLEKVNEQVKDVYNDITKKNKSIETFLKKIPGVKTIVDTFDKKVFDLKPIKGQIDTIFKGFDVSSNSVKNSIDLQKKFIIWLEKNLTIVESYDKYIEIKLKDFTEKYKLEKDEKKKNKYKLFIGQMDFFLKNLKTLIWNLELARKRMIIRLDSAVKLSLAMSSSRPIFKTLLSVAVIETGTQQAVEASIKSIQNMWSTIDALSSDLTDRTIESSKKAEELTNSAILNVNVYVENVEKLKKHFEDMEKYRESLKAQKKKDDEAFKQAQKNLKEIKENKVDDYEELEDILSNDVTKK